jgi:hypothetical protein
MSERTMDPQKGSCDWRTPMNLAKFYRELQDTVGSAYPPFLHLSFADLSPPPLLPPLASSQTSL